MFLRNFVYLTTLFLYYSKKIGIMFSGFSDIYKIIIDVVMPYMDTAWLFKL